MNSYSYEVITAAGALIRTFSTHTDARRWAQANRETFPGLRIECVERIERRNRLWTDRASLRVEAA